jgi:branched-subunit amino acid aminotransferase/4-amino-4-deoxychorismate lyase
MRSLQARAMNHRHDRRPVLPERRNAADLEAKVSVLDRGFIFGDGIYDVTPVYGQRLFRFDEHMARLARSWTRCASATRHSRDGGSIAAGVNWSRRRPSHRRETSWSTSRSRAASRPRPRDARGSSSPRCS